MTAGLPHEEFRHFVSTLDNIPQGDLTLDLVTTRLLNEDAGHRANAIERPSTVAYSAHTIRNVVCYACKKKGHYASACPDRKTSGGRNGKGREDSEEATVAEENGLLTEVAGIALSGQHFLAT